MPIEVAPVLRDSLHKPTLPESSAPVTEQFGSLEIISPGQWDCDRICIACPGAVSGGIVLDLRYANAMTAWGQIVANGIMSCGGMVGFKVDSPPSRD
jgi:hypothetical protein